MTRFDPVAALEARVASDGAQPLLTCYDLADGSRVEFSARTLANWVDKTANLVTSLDVDEDGDVGLSLLLTHPGHWVGMVWALAVWQAGGRVLALPREAMDRVELAVVGPDRTHPVPGVETVVCSLHPLGAGLAQRPAGVTDYAEVLSQPDVHWRNNAPQVFLDHDGTRHDAAAMDEVAPSAARMVLTPSGDPWQDLVAMLLSPLRGGGSTVVVRGGDDPERLAAIARDERALLS